MCSIGPILFLDTPKEKQMWHKQKARELFVGGTLAAREANLAGLGRAIYVSFVRDFKGPRFHSR